MKLWKKITACSLGLALGLGTGALLAGCNGNEEKAAAARMQVDINPSVEFILDSNEKVLSVTALNDDGSLIIAGEAFVGKTADEAVKMMVSISTDAGYLVKGDATANENGITVSITADAKVAEDLYNDVKKSVNEFLDKSGVNAAIQKGEALKLEALRDMVRKADPTLTEEQINAMTEEQLLNTLKIARIETAQLITEELRQAYVTAREYEFDFAEREATKNVINGLGNAYKEIVTAYSAALDAYQGAIAKVEQARYDNFVAADSDYQKALAEVRAQKDKVLEQRKEVAALSEGAAKEAAKAALEMEEGILKTKEAALTIAGETAKAAFDGVIAAMKLVEAPLVKLEEAFPEEITTALTENTKKVQDAMNKAKDEAFAKFEKAHKEDIQKALADLEARKQALIEANKAA